MGNNSQSNVICILMGFIYSVGKMSVKSVAASFVESFLDPEFKVRSPGRAQSIFPFEAACFEE